MTSSKETIRPLNHLAFILDGNRRWAKDRGLSVQMGHKNGAQKVLDIAKWCIEYDIKYLTVYAFSIENFNRAKDELDYLYKYIEIYLKKELHKLAKDGIKVNILGDIFIV